jgi:hypothetical protein
VYTQTARTKDEDEEEDEDEDEADDEEGKDEKESGRRRTTTSWGLRQSLGLMMESCGNAIPVPAELLPAVPFEWMDA